MASERAPLLQKRYGKAPPPPPAQAVAAPAAAIPMVAEPQRPSFQNIPITFPRNIISGEPIIRKPYNVYLASLKPTNANLTEVEKTKRDAFQTLLDQTFYHINDYNRKYGLSQLPSLSSGEIKDVIIEKLEFLRQDYININAALEEIKEERDELRRLKRQSPSLYTVAYENVKRRYELGKDHKAHIEQLHKFLREVNNDIDRLLTNLNSIRQVKQQRATAATAGAGGTGIALPVAAAATENNNNNSNNNNSKNSLQFNLEGRGRRRNTYKRRNKHRKTKRHHK